MLTQRPFCCCCCCCCCCCFCFVFVFVDMNFSSHQHFKIRDTYYNNILPPPSVSYFFALLIVWTSFLQCVLSEFTLFEFDYMISRNLKRPTYETLKNKTASFYTPVVSKLLIIVPMWKEARRSHYITAILTPHSST